MKHPRCLHCSTRDLKSHRCRHVALTQRGVSEKSLEPASLAVWERSCGECVSDEMFDALEGVDAGDRDEAADILGVGSSGGTGLHSKHLGGVGGGEMGVFVHRDAVPPVRRRHVWGWLLVELCRRPVAFARDLQHSVDHGFVVAADRGVDVARGVCRIVSEEHCCAAGDVQAGSGIAALQPIGEICECRSQVVGGERLHD